MTRIKKNKNEIMDSRFPEARIGDIFFVSGKHGLGRLIQGFTGGPVSHVGLVYDGTKGLTFETDGKWRKAGIQPLGQYCMDIAEGRVEFFRYKHYTPAMLNALRDLCDKYQGTPYSYWDCAVNGLLAWAPGFIRRPLVGLLGTKRFCKCDEMTMRIVHQVTGFTPFKDYEQHTPNSMYRIVAWMPYSRNFWKVDYWTGVIDGVSTSANPATVTPKPGRRS